MKWNVAGQVEVKLRTRWCDGMAHLVMTRLELMQRLLLRWRTSQMTASWLSVQAVGKKCLCLFIIILLCFFFLK